MEIIRDRHEPALRSLALGSGNLDELPVKIDRAPIQSSDFLATQASEHADCHSRENLFRTSGEQRLRLPGRENSDLFGRNLDLRSLGNGIAGAVATSSAEGEEVVNNPAIVNSRLRRADETGKPPIDVACGQTKRQAVP